LQKLFIIEILQNFLAVHFDYQYFTKEEILNIINKKRSTFIKES